jgi:hypothetical protein
MLLLFINDYYYLKGLNFDGLVMEAMKKRIEQAFLDHEVIKIIFQYPASVRAIIKRGLVIEVYDDGFTLEEILDGKVTFSYKYIVEIKGERDNGQEIIE